MYYVRSNQASTKVKGKVHVLTHVVTPNKEYAIKAARNLASRKANKPCCRPFILQIKGGLVGEGVPDRVLTRVGY